MSLKELQNELDIQKWNLSETENKDKCGEMPFCAQCDKSVEFPCATAFNKANEKKEAAPVAKAAAKVAPATKKTVKTAKKSK